MKTTLTYLAILGSLILFAFSSCKSSDKHFLKDEKYRAQVHQQFLERKELAKGRSNELFSVLDREDLSLEKREALEFLYAYMPLSDLADYDGDFFLRQVEGAFEAREYFDWGKKIPEDMFRHFVLVYRVNNEDLDDARHVFFEELKDRVKGMSMEDAVLEVNHWCHEKVTYRATDGRTSSPLALAKTSWGRCGEESTFTALALRSVGIPARQCYTPRWAHTDDNHAWVEAWVDGKWHYIGACEPEPELNVAWFTAPAKRAMMVHTNVFGLYNGPEEKNVENDLYSIINVLDTYADTRQVGVKVVDAAGNAVEGATVKFNVYNYAQFYPLSSNVTDAEGNSSIMSGKGSILLWANKGDSYGYTRSNPADDLVTITLNRKSGEAYDETFVMEAPAEQAIKELSPEVIAANAGRLAHEDSLRNSYMQTFIQEDVAKKLATDNNLDANKAWDILNKAQGNWSDISSFMVQYKDNPYLFDFLSALSEKDLRDTPADYLSEHLGLGEKVGVKAGTPKGLYASAVFSPRISVELIRPWRSYAQENMTEDIVSTLQANPMEIVEYIRQNIKIDDKNNYYNCPISPRGVFEMKVADKRSRDILFVAICRSAGIPARIDVATARPQYYENSDWKDVSFEAQKAESPKGSVLFTNYQDNIVKPAYSTHYTLARYENGDFKTLNFRNEVSLRVLPGKVDVDAGYYRLTIGSRANDGSVTVYNKYFEVKEKGTEKLEIKLPKTEGRIQVQGIVDPNTIVDLGDGNNKTLKELMNGKGILLCFADPDKEPTKHILQDLPAVSSALEEWGGGILFLVPDDKLSRAFDASVFNGLPKQSQWSTDNGRKLLNSVAGSLQIEFSNNFPLTVYLNTNGGILFSSQGYRIGIGENIIKTIIEEQATKK